MPNVNPRILKWARETAGLDLVSASSKLGLRATERKSPPERLAALEAGETVPSRTLLATIAKQYRRPLLVFYLSEPPRVVNRGEDLRTLPPDYTEMDEALLDALIRDVRVRQSMIRALMEAEDEAVEVLLVGAGELKEGTDVIAKRIIKLVGFELAEYRAAADSRAAFKYLRSTVESAGVFVLLIGDLGSHHTSLGVETFRGVSLADPFAPMVVINDRDAPSAWSFTLLHELTHIYLGQTTISGAWSEIEIEHLCNEVAGEVLLPVPELGVLRGIGNQDLQTVQARITEFAREHNVSSTMVAYRLRRQGFLAEAQWRTLRSNFKELWVQSSRDRRAKSRESNSAPTYYIVRRHRLGSHLTHFVARMLDSGALTTAKAGHILGVKPGNVHSILDPI